MDGNARLFPRSAGVLLPVSSLPSPYGIGSFGKSARKWIDFLHEAGQSFWQILPLGPTGYGSSPYQCFSAFAGNPYFIDLDTLCEEGLLVESEYKYFIWGASESQVDYGAVHRHREAVLRKAFARFTDETALDAFIANNPWFDEYGLFTAIKADQGQLSWEEWETPLRQHHPEAVEAMRSRLAEDIRYHAFVQYQFYRQWLALRAYANVRNIQIIGDIPIYVSLDSADAWANHSLFQLDGNAYPVEVAGCPPDSFSKEGQLWGNPLYNWEDMAGGGYPLWMPRLQSRFALYDVLRIDHFRGLESYYAIPYGEKTAEIGQWKPGPGMDFIRAIKQAFPEARIIAEDLGFLTEAVRQLRRDSGFPGMKILQFAFDAREPGEYAPYSYDFNAVVYPGTHDNDTVKGWSKTAPPSAISYAKSYMGLMRKSRLPQAMIRLAMQCNADLAIITMQDWLGLGSKSRINTPSTVNNNNWCWRLTEKALGSRLANAMAKTTQLYGRHPRKAPNSP